MKTDHADKDWLKDLPANTLQSIAVTLMAILVLVGMLLGAL